MLIKSSEISSTRPNLFFRIAWHLRTNIKSSREVSMIIFPLVTDSVSHAGKELKTLPIRHVPCAPGRRCLTSNPRQCLKSLEISKETVCVF